MAVQPLVWFFFPLLGFPHAIQTETSGIFAFLADAGIFVIIFENMEKIKEIKTSLLANLVSFLACAVCLVLFL